MRALSIVSGIAVLVLLVALGYLGYIVYQNMPGEPESFGAQDNVSSPGIATEVSLLNGNMRFNHNNISYYIKKCEFDKYDNINEAFQILENETKILSFYRLQNDKADIVVKCSPDSIQEDEKTLIAGEGGPIFTNGTLYPVVQSGFILLYNYTECEYPVVEIHEILHVFGFNHTNNKKDIMYPISDCKQRLSKLYADYLKELYSIAPKAELYFDYANMTKSGKYLNFNVLVLNKGIIDANATLDVYEDGKKRDSFDLNLIEFGAGKTFSVKNLALSSRSAKLVGLRIFSDTEEYDKTNNVFSANFG